MRYVEEEITLAELADRFLHLNDFTTPDAYDMDGMGIEVETIDPASGEKVFKPIKAFVVKEPVVTHYTDGNLRGTADHRLIENSQEVRLADHSEFFLVNEPMSVVDIEVDELASYLANGRLHHNTTSGGKAIAFHASIRIRLSLIGKITDSNKNVIGVKVKANIVKNRIGPPHRVAEFDIYFDRGIDEHGAWLSVLKEHKILKQAGAWYSYLDKSGEEVKFQSKDFPKFLEDDSARKEELYNKICETVITQYQSAFDPDLVGLDSGEDD